MNTTDTYDILRNDFIDGLITFSGGAISLIEANKIADRELRPSDYFPGSPVGHKGPYWQAKNYVRYQGLLSEEYLPKAERNIG